MNLDTVNHIDRAKQRRNELGIDYTHIDTTSKVFEASVNKPIDENNKGFKLLKNLGWKEGEGLGKNENVILEPVDST